MSRDVVYGLVIVKHCVKDVSMKSAAQKRGLLSDVQAGFGNFSIGPLPRSRCIVDFAAYMHPRLSPHSSPQIPWIRIRNLPLPVVFLLPFFAVH